MAEISSESTDGIPAERGARACGVVAKHSHVRCVGVGVQVHGKSIGFWGWCWTIDAQIAQKAVGAIGVAVSNGSSVCIASTAVLA